MTTLKALKDSLYWQQLVYRQSTDPVQRERVAARIAKLEAQIADFETPHSPNCPATDGFGCNCDSITQEQTA